ncbi:MAG: O-antigen ligase family protein [Thermoanaerobaculia bacterium]
MRTGRAWRASTVAGLLALGVAWTLLAFGGRQPVAVYRCFLILAAALALAGSSAGSALWRRRFAPLWLVGLALLASVALRPTLQGAGFTHAALGWMALALSLHLALPGRPWTQRLVAGLVLAGALEAAYGLAQALGGAHDPGGTLGGLGRVATGTFSNRNHFAGLLNMALPLALGSLAARFAAPQREPRSELYAKTWLVLLVGALMGLAVVLSRSRGGTLTLLLTIAFVGILLTALRRRRRGGGLPATAALVLLLVILALGSALGTDALMARFRNLEESQRPEVWLDTLQLIRQTPWTGVGPGMYEWRFRPYQRPEVSKWYRHAHNDYLETAAEWGIPLALLWWSFVGWRFLGAWRTLFRSGDPQRQGLALGASGAMAAMALHSLVDFNLHTPANLLVFCMILGLSWANDLGQRAPTGAAEVSRRLRLAALALLAVALAVAAYRVSRRFIGAEIARDVASVADFERALSWDPEEPGYHAKLGLLLRERGGKADLTGARERLEEAVRLNPFNWRYRLELGWTYELAGQLEPAERALTAAIELNRGSPSYQWRLANFFVRAGDPDRALPHLQAAMRDPELQAASLPLLVKLGVRGRRLVENWPADRASRLGLLRLLVGAADEPWWVRDDELLASLWSELIDGPEPPSLTEGETYLAHLLAQGRFVEARGQWAALNTANGRPDKAYAEGRNLVWNGEMELPLSRGELDWRQAATDAVAVRRAEASGFGGSAALEIELVGVERPGFRWALQRVVVSAAGPYVLALQARGEGTGGQLALEVVRETDGRSLLVTEPVADARSWTTIGGVFQSAEDQGVVVLRLRRLETSGATATLAARLWLDTVRLAPVLR